MVTQAYNARSTPEPGGALLSTSNSDWGGGER